MKPLTWIPERFSRSGGLAASGFEKLLGRPKLDPLAVLVRETAQNSWDARSRNGSVDYRIDLWSSLLVGERQSLRKTVFKDLPPQLSRISSKLAGDFPAIYVCDRGTKGLGGPVSAEKEARDGVYDWVDFILNVGKPNTHGQTGGTYGFGKTIAYVVSSISSIVVYSRTAVGGKLESRLIACAIGEQFSLSRVLHTGRHWWGLNDSGSPAPVVGNRADQIADLIGMPPFKTGESGTNILILDPSLEDRSPKQAATFLAESVLWHLWPKLMPRGARKSAPMSVHVTLDGKQIEIPRPQDRPPLHGFAQAFRALLDEVDCGRRADGLERTVISSFRPKADLGDLVTVPLVGRPRVHVDDSAGSDVDDTNPAAMISGPSHHVALLRSPELVVEYLEGPTASEAGTEWAGVFRCRREEDEHFAAAEPPTHDSWNVDLLAKSAGKTKVKMALQRIQESLRERWITLPNVNSTQVVKSTAAIAGDLASLVQPVAAKGPGQPDHGADPRGKGTSGLSQTVVELISSSVVLLNGSPGTRLGLRVRPAGKAAEVSVRVSIGVALDDGASASDLDPALCLVKAQFPTHSVSLMGVADELKVPGNVVSTFDVLVARSEDSAVSFEATAKDIVP